MNTIELVFIPFPGLSHLLATVETANHLLHHDDRLSITVLILHPRKETHKTSPNPSASPRLHFTHLSSPAEAPTVPGSPFDLIDAQTALVREAVSNRVKQNSRPAGLVLDMFCTRFTEVADEFGIPSYVFFTSGACGLGMFHHALSMKDEPNQDLTRYKNSDADLRLRIPCFSNPVPVGVVPAEFIDGGPMADSFLNNFRRMRETKGIMVNTFYELDSYAVDFLASDEKSPKLYPVGPILQSGSEALEDDDVSKWLDCQPGNSVVFLCYGTMGSFEEVQVREIALALENSGHPILLSLKEKSPLNTWQRQSHFGGMDTRHTMAFHYF